MRVTDYWVSRSVEEGLEDGDGWYVLCRAVDHLTQRGVGFYEPGSGLRETALCVLLEARKDCRVQSREF